MLQLATILSMSKRWKNRVQLRVFLCIDAINSRTHCIQKNLDDLLNQLRIKAQTRLISYDHLHEFTTTNAFTNTNNNEYLFKVNELIRKQCENTACIYLYLPRPPIDKQHSQRYIEILDLLSKDLPSTLFVHGVSSVTCTHL